VHFVVVTIPDGIREMPAVANAEAGPVAEDASQSEMGMTRDAAECREDEVQPTTNQEESEHGRQETATEDSCVSAHQQQQQCLTNSDVRLSSESGGDDHDDSKMIDDVVSSQLITNAEVKPLFQDSGEEKVSEDDRQPNAVEDTGNEADVYREDVASTLTSAETNTDVTIEEEESESHIGHRKYLLYSYTYDHDEKITSSEVEQKQSVVQDELNSREQRMQQNAKHTDETGDSEADNGRAENNDSAVEESINCNGETAENIVKESEFENNFSESDSRCTKQAVGSGKESTGNEETEQFPENTSGQVSDEHLKSVEESTGETGTQAESRLERNVLTPDIPTEGDENVQQCMTNGKSELISDRENENIEQHLLVHNRTVPVEQHAVTETRETPADSTDACNRSTFEGPMFENESDTNGAESVEEQTNQAPPETSTEKDGYTVDSVQPEPAESQPNYALESVEQKVTVQQINCKQDIQNYVTNAMENDNEQSGKSDNDYTETEEQYVEAETTKTTERSEVEVAEVDDKTISLSENSIKRVSTEEDESAVAQCYVTDKEDNAVERLIVDDANLKDLHAASERTTDEMAEDSGAKVDENVEVTNRYHPVQTDEVHAKDAMNADGQHEENVPDYDEADKNIQRNTEQSNEISETTQGKSAGVDKDCSPEDGYNTQEVQKESDEGDQDTKEQEAVTNETSKTLPEQATDRPTTEVRKENDETIVDEESVDAQHLIEILAVDETSKIVEIAESKNSAVNYEQHNKQPQAEKIEPQAEIESQPTAASDLDELNEANATTNELATNNSEKFSTDEKQPYVISADTESQSQSANAVDKSSASDEMCENVEKAIKNGENIVEDEEHRAEFAAEPQTELPSTCITERAAEQPGTEVVKNENHYDKEASENPERNDESVLDAEEPSKHHEIEFVRITESEDEAGDVSEAAEDNAPAAVVELWQKDSVEVEHEHTVETEMEIEQSTETVIVTERSVSVSVKQYSESCAEATQEIQSTEISETAVRMIAMEANDRKESESLVTEETQEQWTNTTDNDQVTYSRPISNRIVDDITDKHADDDPCEQKHGDKIEQNAKYLPIEASEEEAANENKITEAEKSKNIVDEYETITGQTDTTQSMEAVATCNGTFESRPNDNITSASDEAFEGTETDEVSQKDAVVYGESVAISNHETEDDLGPAELTNGRDTPASFPDSAEKHESIRSYVDGCRYIELSGMKLATDQVSHRMIDYCFLFRSLVLIQLSVQLVSKISNLYDPDPPTSQTDRQTDRRTDDINRKTAL